MAISDFVVVLFCFVRKDILTLESEGEPLPAAGAEYDKSSFI